MQLMSLVSLTVKKPNFQVVLQKCMLYYHQFQASFLQDHVLLLVEIQIVFVNQVVKLEANEFVPFCFSIKCCGSVCDSFRTSTAGLDACIHGRAQLEHRVFIFLKSPSLQIKYLPSAARLIHKRQT